LNLSQIILILFLELYPLSADLIRDRFGTIFESKRLQPKEFTPNIDNPLLALDTTVENILHSYFMLFCRRCHRYDCFLHKDKSVTPDLNYQSKNFNLIYQPCHAYCYRRESKSSYSQKRTKIKLKRSQSEFLDKKIFSTPIKNGFHSKRLKSNLIKSEQISSSYRNGFLIKSSYKRKLNDDLSNWLASEKSLFRIFATIFGDNICMIANLLDKSCSQVYTFYSNEKNQLLSANILDRKINGEYKKRINGMMIKSDNEDESMEDETKMCDGNDNQPSVSIVLSISDEYIFFSFSDKYKSFVFSSFSFIDISSST
jgi:hypothetical protein